MAFRRATLIAPAAVTASLASFGLATHGQDVRLPSAGNSTAHSVGVLLHNEKPHFLLSPRAMCEGEEEKPSLIEQADQLIEDSRKVKPPPQFEELKRDIGRLSEIQSFDGFRMIVLRNVNMNAAVQHMFWMGTTALPGGQSSMYNYTMILGDEKSSLQLTTDPSFNINGEVRTQLDAHYAAKASYMMSNEQGQGNMILVDLDYAGQSMTSNLRLGHQGGTVLQGSFVQAITPQLSVGAQGVMNPNKSVMQQAFAGRYDASDFSVNALLNGTALQVNYVRKVNPNRVNLVADLSMDLASLTSEATVGAEFQLAQSRLHMTVDSKALIKSTIETRINPRMQMQFSAEMLHMKDHYKFGYGLMIGS